MTPVKSDDVATVELQRRVSEARQKRTIDCEREVMALARPILAKYKCRLGVMQEIIDGAPQPARIVVMALD